MCDKYFGCTHITLMFMLLPGKGMAMEICTFRTERIPRYNNSSSMPDHQNVGRSHDSITPCSERDQISPFNILGASRTFCFCNMYLAYTQQCCKNAYISKQNKKKLYCRIIFAGLTFHGFYLLKQFGTLCNLHYPRFTH